MNKKCLLVTTNFPPTRGSGSRRTAAVTKYLARLGWSIFVLTIGDGYYPSSDEDRKYIPDGVKVIKTKMLFPKLFTTTNYKSTTNIQIIDTIFRTAKLLIAGAFHYLLIPDRFLTWLPYGYRAGLNLIKKENIDVIYSTAPYFSTHLLALLLKKKTELPWLAEFRDSWSSNPAILKKNFIKKWIEKKMEKWVIKNSDAIISVHPAYTKEFQSLYPKISSKKFYTITNGFDPENFPSTLTSENNIFTICYAGLIYDHMATSLLHFISAISNLVKNKKIDSQKIKVKFWGKFLPEANRLIDKLGLKTIISHKDFGSHKMALIEQKRGHLLLLFDLNPNIYSTVPAKLYEYFGSQRPVLALTYENSLVKKIIERTNTGRIILNNNIKDIEAAILDYYQGFYSRGKINYSPNTKKVNKYNYQFLVKEIDKILLKINRQPQPNSLV